MYDQRYEDVREPDKRYISNTQTTTIQNICFSNHSIQILALVL